MKEKIRIGFIGHGGVLDNYAEIVQNHPSAELAALCGRSQERAEEAARKYQIPQVYTSYEEMIAKADLDAVAVITPDDLHYPMTMAALNAGLHVACEKPMAMSAAQAKEMLDKAEAKGVVNMVFFTWVWMPHVIYYRKLLEEGFLGRPIDLNVHFIQDHIEGVNYEWRTDPGARWALSATWARTLSRWRASCTGKSRMCLLILAGTAARQNRASRIRSTTTTRR